MNQNKHPLKIAVISPIFPNKRNPVAGIFVRQQSKYIARQGHEVSILTTGLEGPKKEVIDGIPVYRLSKTSTSPIHGLFFSLRCAGKLIALHKNQKIDVIVQNFVGISTIIIGLAALLKNIKFVVVSHGTSWELQKNFPRSSIIRLALSFPKKIICVSRKTAELLETNADRSKIVVINNGIDPESFEANTDSSQFRKNHGLLGKTILLSVCNLVPKKGIDAIINALPEVLQDVPNLTYLIIGDGPEKEKLAELTKKLDIGKNVKFLGVKTGAELSNYYNACDIFILMSRDTGGSIESFGIAYIEASYFGKPVIAGKSGGTEDAVVNGKTGFIVDSEDEEMLIQKIKLLAGSKKLRNKLGNAGRKRVLEGFLWEHNAEKLIREISST